jgi:hypothetical protein
MQYSSVSPKASVTEQRLALRPHGHANDMLTQLEFIRAAKSIVPDVVKDIGSQSFSVVALQDRGQPVD